MPTIVVAIMLVLCLCSLVFQISVYRIIKHTAFHKNILAERSTIVINLIAICLLAWSLYLRWFDPWCAGVR